MSGQEQMDWSPNQVSSSNMVAQNSGVPQSSVTPDNVKKQFVNKRIKQADRNLAISMIKHKMEPKVIQQSVKFVDNSLRSKFVDEMQELNKNEKKSSNSNFNSSSDSLKSFQQIANKISQSSFNLSNPETFITKKSQMINLLNKWKSTTLKSNQFKKQYYKKSKSMLFQQEVKDYLQALFPDLDDQKIQIEIVKNLNFMKLWKNTDCQKQKVGKFIKIIKNSVNYCELQKYNCKDIEDTQRDLKIQIYDVINYGDKLSLDIVQKIMKQPTYNFMSRTDLSVEDKEMLYEKLKADNILEEYCLLLSNPKTLKYRVNKQAESILEEIQKQFEMPAQKKQFLKSLLNDGKQMQFFSLPQVFACLKKIFKFSRQNCPAYMERMKRNGKCIIATQIKKLFQLREKMHQIKVSFDFWQRIQQELLFQGDLNIVDKLPQIGLKNQNELWNWIKKQSEYFILLKSQESLQNMMKRQLESIMVENLQLNLQSIRKIVESLVEHPDETTIQNFCKVSSAELDKIRASPSFTKYKKNLKISPESEQMIAQKELWEIVHKIMVQTNNSINFTKTNDFVQSYLKKPSPQVIDMNKVLSDEFKNILKNEIKGSLILSDFSKVMQKIRNIQIKERYLAEVSKELDKDFRDYLEYFCSVDLDQDGAAIIYNCECQTYLRKEMEKPQFLKSIARLQNTPQFKQFKQAYPFCLNLSKTVSKNSLAFKLKQFMKQIGIGQGPIKSVIRELSDGDYKIEIIRQTAMVSKGQEKIAQFIQSEKDYSIIFNVCQAEQQRPGFIAEIKLNNFIKKLAELEQFNRFSFETKNRLIEQIIESKLGGVELIEEFTKSEAKTVYETINTSDQWKNYSKIEQIPPTQPPIQSPIKPSPKELSNSKQSKANSSAKKGGKGPIKFEDVMKKNKKDFQTEKKQFNIAQMLLDAAKSCQDFEECKSNYKNFLIQNFTTIASKIEEGIFVRMVGEYNDKNQLASEILSAADLSKVTGKINNIKKKNLQTEISNDKQLPKIVQEFNLLYL